MYRWTGIKFCMLHEHSPLQIIYSPNISTASSIQIPHQYLLQILKPPFNYPPLWSFLVFKINSTLRGFPTNVPLEICVVILSFLARFYSQWTYFQIYFSKYFLKQLVPKSKAVTFLNTNVALFFLWTEDETLGAS